jgi:hypothetical protein
MLRASSWLQATAGLALLLTVVAPAKAGDLLHRCFGGCSSSCSSQTVQIPGQEIVVERTAPRVVVHDTRPLRVSGLAAPPVVASFFMPMPIQVGSFGAPPSNAVEERENISLDFSALQAAHDLERSQARVAAYRAIHEAQAKHMQAVLDRVAAIAQQSTPPAATKPPASDKCCEEIKAQLLNLKSRIEALEHQVDYHDRAIRKDPTLKIPEPSK